MVKMIKSCKIYLKIKENAIVNITEKVQKFVDESNIKDGVVMIFTKGSTSAVTTIEYEPNLVKDFLDCLEKIAPMDADYEHHKTWGDRNGASHLRASLIGPSLSVPIENGQLVLGTWQQIVVCNFDRCKREREVRLYFIR